LTVGDCWKQKIEKPVTNRHFERMQTFPLRSVIHRKLSFGCVAEN